MVIAWKGLLYILSYPFGNPSFKGVPDNIQLNHYPIEFLQSWKNIRLGANFIFQMSKLFA